MIKQFENLPSLRLKVTDKCPLDCWFCHNEGSGQRNPTVVGDVVWDRKFSSAIKQLAEILSLQEIHITGGEPTMNPHLVDLVNHLLEMDLELKITTVSNDFQKIQGLLDAGVRNFNFSIHAGDETGFHNYQKNRSFERSREYYKLLLETINRTVDSGANVKINTVISKTQEIATVSKLLDWAIDRNILVRLMAPTNQNTGEGKQAIRTLLEVLGAVKLEERVSFGSSNLVVIYGLPDGYRIGYKQIRDEFLPIMCDNCAFRTTICLERFYGIRLEKRLIDHAWEYVIRLCIHRNDRWTSMILSDFLTSDHLHQIKQKWSTST